jgi:hypothetical protein
MVKRTRKQGQTMISKTLNRKQKVEKGEPHQISGVNAGALDNLLHIQTTNYDTFKRNISHKYLIQSCISYKLLSFKTNNKFCFYIFSCEQITTNKLNSTFRFYFNHFEQSNRINVRITHAYLDRN